MVHLSLSEPRARRLVILVCLGGFITFLIFQLLRVAQSYQRPSQRTSVVPQASITSPGVIICPDREMQRSLIFINQSAACITTQRNVEHLCHAEMTNFSFVALHTTTERCIDIKPGIDFSTTRDIVTLNYLVVDNLTFADPPNDFDLIYIGLYSGEASRQSVIPQVGIGIGFNLLGVGVQDFKTLGGDTERRYVIQQFSSQPAFPGTSFDFNIFTGQRNGVTYSIATFSMFMQNLHIDLTEEVITFGFFDVVSSLGGVFSIIAFIVTYINGNGPEDPYGLVHHFCFPHMVRSQPAAHMRNKANIHDQAQMNVELATLRHGATDTATGAKGASGSQGSAGSPT